MLKLVELISFKKIVQYSTIIILSIFIGFDQIIPLLLIFWLMIKYFDKSYFTRLHIESFLILIFLVAMLLSTFMITDPIRYISFLRDFFQYVMFFILIIFANRKPIQTIKMYVNILLAYIFSHTLFSILYLIIGEIKFNTLASYIMPGFILNTTLGKQLFVKNIGYDAFLFLPIPRISSIFSSAIQYGAFIIFTIFIIYYLYKSSYKLRNKLLYGSLFYINILLLFLTLGRISILLFCLIAPLYLFIIRYYKMKDINNKIINLFFVFLLYFSIIIIFIINSEDIILLFQVIFLDQRSGSATLRFGIYKETILHLFDNFIFGHGTQKDIEALILPLGSHSWPLGVFYKYGILGGIPFIIFLFRIIILSVNNIFYTDTNLKFYSITLFFSFINILLLSLTLEPILDIITFIGLSFVIVNIICIHKIKRKIILFPL